MGINKKIKTILILLLVAGAFFSLVGVGYALIIGGNSNSAMNLQNGLVGWWKFDGNAKDATPYGRNGTVTAATLTTDRKGQSNNAYSFNGSTSNIVLTSNGSTLGLGPNATIAFWYKANSQTDTRRILGYNTSFSQNGQWLFFQSSTFMRFQNQANDGSITASTKIMSLTDGWHHFLGISNGTTLTLYVDGVAQTSGSNLTSPIYNNTNPVQVGVNSSSLDFNGSIDDIRMYNRVLSQAEITALAQEYSPGVSISTLQSGLVGEWKMDGNAKDATPNANNLTNNNGVTFTADRKGQANSAANFVAASSQYLSISSNASLTVPNTSFTFSGWFYLDSYSTQYVRLVSKETTPANFEYSVLIAASNNPIEPNRPYICVQNGTTSYCTSPTTASPSQLSLNTWYFFTAWFDISANTVNFQLNNGVISSVAGPGAGGVNNGAGQFNIGTFGSAYLNGRMDDVRMYKKVLTTAEKTSLYQEYSPGIAISTLQKGLVGQWKLNNNAKDATPNQNNGTITGATLTTDRKGQSNKAYSFNGTSNYIDVPNSSALQLTTGMTISAWVNGTDDNTERTVMRKNSSYFMRINPTGESPRFACFTINNTTEPRVTSSFTSGVWTLYTCTYDVNGGANNLKLYQNGVLVGQGTKTGNIAVNTNDLYIGSTGGSTAFWKGSIADVRVYNRALSQAEITALYQGY